MDKIPSCLWLVTPVSAAAMNEEKRNSEANNCKMFSSIHTFLTKYKLSGLFWSFEIETKIRYVL